MTNLIDKIRKLFQSGTEQTGKDSPMNQKPDNQLNRASLLDEQQIVQLMQLVEATEEGHYTCAETFDLLDEYVEMVVGNQDAARLMPIVKRHLDACPGCHEKYNILLTILQSSD